MTTALYSAVARRSLLRQRRCMQIVDPHSYVEFYIPDRRIYLTVLVVSDRLRHI